VCNVCNGNDNDINVLVLLLCVIICVVILMNVLLLMWKCVCDISSNDIIESISNINKYY